MFDTSHVAVRNCDFYGDQDRGGFGVVSYSANWITDVVLYGNTFHDNGIWDPDAAQGDRDVGATFVSKRARNVWVIDNVVYHVESTGIIVTAGNTEPAELTHHIYVGRNVSHHNKQDGFWIKNGQDVIFSENIAYGHRRSTSSLGAGLGYQYDPSRVWFLCNESYDNEYGIRSGSTNFDTREEMYILGNVIHDNTYGIRFATPGVDYETVLGNTIYDVNTGISSASGSAGAVMVNNILAQIDGDHISFPSAAYSDLSYSLLESPVHINWGEHPYTSVASFQSGASEGVGCIEAAPQFIDAENSDFHLQPTSPAIEAGASLGVVPQVFARFQQLYGIDIRTDIEGRARPQGSTWDIGAYEYVLAALGDLAVSGTSQNSITLAWTVPGEEGVTGTAGPV